jgi:hypothetical protein
MPRGLIHRLSPSRRLPQRGASMGDRHQPRVVRRGGVVAKDRDGGGPDTLVARCGRRPLRFARAGRSRREDERGSPYTGPASRRGAGAGPSSLEALAPPIRPLPRCAWLRRGDRRRLHQLDARARRSSVATPSSGTTYNRQRSPPSRVTPAPRWDGPGWDCRRRRRGARKVPGTFDPGCGRAGAGDCTSRARPSGAAPRRTALGQPGFSPRAQHGPRGLRLLRGDTAGTKPTQRVRRIRHTDFYAQGRGPGPEPVLRRSAGYAAGRARFCECASSPRWHERASGGRMQEGRHLERAFH